MPTHPKHSAPWITVILAGGASTRMGMRDKAEIELGGNRLIDIVYARAQIQCDEIILSTSKDYGLSCSHIPDDPTLPGGPAGGVLTVARILRARPAPPHGFFTVPVDGPNLGPEFCETMYDASCSTFAQGPIRTHPGFAWWRLTDLEDVLAALNKAQSLSLHRLAALCGSKPVMWDEEAAFFNMNTEDDLRQYMDALP